MGSRELIDLIQRVTNEQLKDTAMTAVRECAADTATMDRLRIIGGEWKGIIRMRDVLINELKKREENDDG